MLWRVLGREDGHDAACDVGDRGRYAQVVCGDGDVGVGGRAVSVVVEGVDDDENVGDAANVDERVDGSVDGSVDVDVDLKEDGIVSDE